MFAQRDSPKLNSDPNGGAQPCSTTTRMATADPVLRWFRAAINEVYGDRIERVVLYGSRARGDARPDSDYDVAVFLKQSGSFWEEAGRIAIVETDILYETGAVIHAIPFRADAIRSHTAFMRELRREGFDL